MLIRLQKYLAEAGIASRRKSEEIILQGLVSVNGQIINELGYKVDDEKDIVKFNNKIIKNQLDLEYYILNKPKGYITTVDDQFQRPNVMDLIKEDKRLFPIGRLDYDTSGLLIITNDGDLTYRLTHPKHSITKYYIAKVKGIPTSDEIYNLQNGVDIGGYITNKAIVEILEKSNYNAILKIGITEGKNRQVRRMCFAIGHPIINLSRVAIGSLELDGLKEGQYRPLTEKEIGYLKNC